NFYKELALQFAEQGIHALAIDYFGRTAPIHTPRDESFEFMPHVSQIQYPTFLLDVRAALSYLQSHATSSGAPSPAIFTCGFCMGGALSLLTATQPDLPLAGAIAFYSGFGRRFAGTEAPTLDNAVNTRVPVLGLYGGADQGIPPEQIEQLEKNLTTASVPHEIHVYPGAPHSFFDRKATEFAEASTDSWIRTLNFIHTNTPTS
ncbi:MAG: dienelactone hydrolase family protein, partial [Chloroflexia bacterium]